MFVVFYYFFLIYSFLNGRGVCVFVLFLILRIEMQHREYNSICSCVVCFMTFATIKTTFYVLLFAMKEEVWIKQLNVYFSWGLYDITVTSYEIYLSFITI